MKIAMKFLMFGCLTGVLLFNSCSNDDGGNSKKTPQAEIATSISLASGDSQTAEVLTVLTNPIEILVNDQNGNPFAGATVNFSVSEGTLSTTTATTNTNGIASVSWTLGASIGTQSLIVTAFKVNGTTPLAGAPILITATAAPEPLVAESLNTVLSEIQTTVVETALTNPIEILVYDQNGDPFAGAIVNFTVVEGSLSEATATTDTNGIATVEWTLGATVGFQTLMVTGFKADGTTPLTNSPLSLSARAIQPIIVGEFKHGGVVFYVDETGKHGLVCAVNDLSMAKWGCTGIELTGTDNLQLGGGYQNTLNIIAGCTTSGIAADICANLNLNGFTDWFLPSRDALNEMYINKDAINATATGNGGTEFISENYWSSSQDTTLPTYGAFQLDFEQGNQFAAHKANNLHIRAIRSF